MESPWQTLLNWIGGAALAVGGWLFRVLYESIRELEKNLADHKQEVARDYVTNLEMRRIEDKLDRILERLQK